MHGEPGQYTQVFVACSAAELEHGHRLVDLVFVSRSLFGRIREVCVRTSVDICILELDCTKAEVTWRKALMSSLNRKQGSVHNGLVALLVEAFACDLRQEVI